MNQDRLEAFTTAASLVEPIIDKHGVEDVRNSVNVFAAGITTTKSEQHINSILHVADWLLDEEDV